MTSALASLINATAAFEVATVGTITEVETGNILPATETVTVSLYLRKSSPTKSELPGLEVETQTYEGHAISPQALDARIRAGTKGVLNFAGQGAVTCEVLGCRLPYGSTGLLGSTVQQVLGDHIRLAQYAQI